MVFAPLTSDAPLYHWPRATIGLIAANVLAYLLLISGLAGNEEQVLQRFALVLGAGLRPHQWMTSNFVHLSFLHLAGNMLFLWAFGLIVEGKVGWRRFLIIYLGAGVLECFCEQLCLLSIPPGTASLGASAVVFALMAIALVWAPRNDLIVAYWLPLTRVGTVDVSILLFSLLFVAGQFILAWIAGLTLSSQLLHLLGAVIGFVIGTVTWYRGTVDCEGWDLFSVLRGRHRSNAASDMYITSLKDSGDAPVLKDSSPARRRKKPGDEQRGATRRKVKCINRVRSLLNRKRPLEALGAFREARHVLPDWRLPSRDHLRLAAALEENECWNECVELWEDYLQRHPEASHELRLSAASIMLHHQRRPQAALNMIDGVLVDSLSHEDRERWNRIGVQARAMLDAGVIELDAKGDGGKG